MASAHIWEFHSVLRGPLEIVFLTKLSVLFPGCFRRIADKPSLNPWVIFFVALAIELKMCKETENFQKQERIWKQNPEVQALKNLFVLRSEMSNFRVATRMPSSCRKIVQKWQHWSCLCCNKVTQSQISAPRRFAKTGKRFVPLSLCPSQAKVNRHLSWVHHRLGCRSLRQEMFQAFLWLSPLSPQIILLMQSSHWRIEKLHAEKSCRFITSYISWEEYSPSCYAKQLLTGLPTSFAEYIQGIYIKELCLALKTYSCALFFKIRTEALRCSVDHSRRKDATQFVPTQCKYYRFSLHTQDIDLCRHHIRMLTCYISMPDQASSNASGSFALAIWLHKFELRIVSNSHTATPKLLAQLENFFNLAKRAKGESNQKKQNSQCLSKSGRKWRAVSHGLNGIRTSLVYQLREHLVPLSNIHRTRQDKEVKQLIWRHLL